MDIMGGIRMGGCEEGAAAVAAGIRDLEEAAAICDMKCTPGGGCRDNSIELCASSDSKVNHKSCATSSFGSNSYRDSEATAQANGCMKLASVQCKVRL